MRLEDERSLVVATNPLRQQICLFGNKSASVATNLLRHIQKNYLMNIYARGKLDRSSFFGQTATTTQNSTKHYEKESKIRYGQIKQALINKASLTNIYYGMNGGTLIGQSSKIYLRNYKRSKNMTHISSTEQFWSMVRKKHQNRCSYRINVEMGIGVKCQGEDDATVVDDIHRHAVVQMSQHENLTSPMKMKEKSTNRERRAASQSTEDKSQLFLNKVLFTPISPLFHSMTKEMYTIAKNYIQTERF